jgi:uncharacterized protein YxjI
MTISDAQGGPSKLTGPTIFNTNEIVMKKRILSLREHYDIEDRSGNRLAEGEGNFFQIPAIFMVKDPRSNMEIMEIEGKIFSLRNQFTIKDRLGVPLGTVQKKILTFIGQEFWLEKDDAEIMRVYGDFLNHDYSMEVKGQQVASIHRKWMSIRDQFDISIMGPVDHRLVVGATIVIEHIMVQSSAANAQ